MASLVPCPVFWPVFDFWRGGVTALGCAHRQDEVEMFIVSPATVWNDAALRTRQVPRRIFGRVALIPRSGASAGLLLRMLLEVQLLRYLLPLLPILAIGFAWPDTAFALSNAPLLMLLMIWLVEMRLLRIPPRSRAALIDPANAERGLDLLRVRAVDVLTRIAAGRGLMAGQLHLVVEQSELARIAPLTYVSVQTGEGPDGRPAVLNLSPDEEKLIRQTLFQPPLDERRLQLINLSQDQCLRDIALDLRNVSAHVRLSAMIGGAT